METCSRGLGVSKLISAPLAIIQDLCSWLWSVPGTCLWLFHTYRKTDPPSRYDQETEAFSCMLDFIQVVLQSLLWISLEEIFSSPPTAEHTHNCMTPIHSKHTPPPAETLPPTHTRPLDHLLYLTIFISSVVTLPKVWTVLKTWIFSQNSVLEFRIFLK